MKLSPFSGLALCLSFLAWCAVREAQAQLTNWSVLHSFGYPQRAGYIPSGPLTEGREGMLYGFTAWGGGNFEEGGVIFKVGRDGRGYTVLHHFGLSTPDDVWLGGGLLEGSDGALYGMRAGWRGMVFKLRKDGGGFTVLHTFGAGTDPRGPLVEASDGALYGATDEGYGAIFKMNRDGSDYGVVAYVLGVNGVIEGTDGALYGTTEDGIVNHGTVFRVSKQGLGFTTLHVFVSGAEDGANPLADLLEGRDGWLYGTTSRGGSHGGGTVFKLRKDGTGYQALRSFGDKPGDAQYPESALVEAAGVLYGTTAGGGTNGHGTVFKMNRDGTGYAVLREFTGTNSDGSTPGDSPLATRDGWLYGTTRSGGLSVGWTDRGTLFRLQRDGTGYEIICNFHERFRGDGIRPTGLAEGSDGNLYVTTEADDALRYPGKLVRSSKDGANYAVQGSVSGSGVALIEGSDGLLYGINNDYEYDLLIRIGKDGANQTVLHKFYTSDDGSTTGVIEASDGAFYGTTTRGGDLDEGTVYRVDKVTGQREILHRFGWESSAGGVLLEGSDGHLYGIFSRIEEPFIDGRHGGAVFAIHKDGSGYIELHRFDRAPDGHFIAWDATLMEGSDGHLYGTTTEAGPSTLRTVFRLGKEGSNYTVLHSFSNSLHVPEGALSGLFEGEDGALYGIKPSSSGLAEGRAIFKFQKDGTGLRVLTHGGDPWKMIQGRDGAFYGLGSTGGATAFGTLFRYGHAMSLERTAGGARLGLTGIPGYTYQLERSTDLSHWTTLQTVLMPESALLQYDDLAAPAGVAFYRLRVR